MNANQKIQNQIEQNNDRMEDLQRQAMQILEHIENSAREARERGDARIAVDTLEYDIRHLAELNADRKKIWETIRMLEYFLRNE